MWDFLRVWTPDAHLGGEADKFLVLVTPPDPVVHAVCHRNDRGAGTGMLGGLSPAAIAHEHSAAIRSGPTGAAGLHACADLTARNAGCPWDGVLEADGPSPRHWCRCAAPGERVPAERASHIYMDDVRPLVEALVERHPDLEHLRGDVVARSRYVTCLLVCVFALADGVTAMSIPRRTFCSSPAMGHFFTCARVDLSQLTAFSPTYTVPLSAAFQRAGVGRRDRVVAAERLGADDNLGSLCPAILKRIGTGRCRPLSSGAPGLLNFEDFVWTWLAFHDRMKRGSLQYWFRALDRDDDGVLDRLDLACALNDRAAEAGEDALEPHHALTRVLDAVEPACRRRITTMDIKRRRAGPLVFDLLIQRTGDAKTGGQAEA